MTDKKISELTNLTGANVADDDEFAIVDTSAVETKAITASELRTAIGNGNFTVTGNLTVEGTTVTIDSASAQTVDLGDNDKIRLGDGDDLQIYHDGNHSKIVEAGTGVLEIQTNGSEIQVTGGSGTEYLARFINNGAFQAYYDNSLKLATTSTGIDVTGTVTADGLTVEKSISSVIASASGTVGRFINNANSSDAAIVDIVGGNTSVTSGEAISALYLSDANANGRGRVQYNHQNDNLELYSAAVPRLNIANNGDISFYEDTGTTAKFFWDASAESLGIGVGSSVGEALHVKGVGRFENSNATPVSVHINSGNHDYGQILASTSSAWKNLVLNQYGGNVGIGTASPSQKLHVEGAGNQFIFLNNSTTNDGFYFKAGAGASSIQTNSGSHVMNFFTSGSERMRIDSSGRVLLGHTSSIPVEGNEQKLQLVGSDANDGITIARFNNNYGPYLSFGRSGSGTIGSYTAVPVDDELGRIQWGVADGTDMASIGASISAFTEELAASNDVPSRLVFSTTANNASTPTERMRIDSSGNVGIGDTSPYTWSSVQPSLNLRGTSASFPNRSGALIFKSQSGTHMTVMDFETGNDLRWYQSSNSGSSWSERMRLDSSGNVGIGTASPVANTPLTLQGPSGYTDTLWLKSVGTNIDSRINIAPTGTGNAQINNTVGTAIEFQTSGSERMRIDSSGNVGIGTNSPAVPLHVKVNTDQNFYMSSDSGVRIQAMNDAGSVINTMKIGGDPLIFLGTGGTERMRIDSSGNVGINMTPDSAVKLSVSGAIGPTNGSAGSPTHTFYSDSDTGMYRAGANTLGFSTGGSERMRIDSSGNLILKATSDTGSRLQINGADETSELLEIGITSGHAQLTATHASGGSNTAGFIFRTRGGGSTAERMRITSAGRVGVGVTDPDAGIELQTSLGDLNSVHIANTSSTGYGAKFIGGGNTVLRYIADFRDYNNQSRLRVDGSGNLNLVSSGSSLIDLNFTDSSVNNYARIVGGKSGSGVGELRFSTYSGGLSEAMRIDSSGRVGIGITSPIEKITANGAIVSIGSSSTLSTSGANRAILDFTSGGARIGHFRGTTAAGSGYASFYTDSTERMRIDSSGNLLVGTTNGNPTGNHEPGTLIAEYGQINVHRDGGNPLRVGSSVDGNLTEYYKQGALVGSIGVAGGNNLKIASTATDHAGLAFGTHVVAPLEANADSDSTIDLGAGAARFKDLYLSGGVYLGGTGSSNKLDDYEEGTHNITLNQGGVGVNSSYQTWRYTKIGRMVYIEGLFLATSGGDTNIVKINLPFTYLSRSGNTADLIIQTVGAYNVPTGSGGLKGSIVNNTSLLRFNKSVDNGAWTSLVGTDMASGDHIYVNLAYPTT